MIAITRQVSPAIGRCELTHLARAAIDVERAARQHAEYERLLAELGCEVRSLPAEAELPDSVFVEDAAVVFDEVAVIARPGAPSRRPETGSIAEALRADRELSRIEPPATLDGGDVLRLGRRVRVGRSRRTDAAGVEQLRALLAPFGYAVEAVPVRGCLHLKSAATQIGPETVLVNPEWVDAEAFAPLERIEIDPAEPFAANVLRLGEMLVAAAACPRTRERLERRGFTVRPIDVSELTKAEGGVTCCSLVYRRQPEPTPP